MRSRSFSTGGTSRRWRRLAHGLVRRSLRCAAGVLCLLAIPLVSPAEESADAPPDTTRAYGLVPTDNIRALYLRYGEPGAVNITSRHGEDPDSAEATGEQDSLVAAAEDSAATAAPAMTLREQIRLIIRDELSQRFGPQPAAAPGPREEHVETEGPGADPTTLLDVEPGQVLGQSDAAPDDEPRRPTGVTATPERTQPSEITIVQQPPAGDGSAGRLTRGREELEPDVVRRRLIERGLLRTNLIIFETDTAKLSPRSRDVIETVGEVLAEMPEAKVRIEGHADPRGPDDYNLMLSRERAEAVRGYLVECCGLDPARLQAEGYGEERPLVSGTSPTDLALNRRVEFRITNPSALRSRQVAPSDAPADEEPVR